LICTTKKDMIRPKYAELGVWKERSMDEVSNPRDFIQASIASIQAYRRGECASFISPIERHEQGMSGGLSREEQALVQGLLALPDDEEAQVAALRSLGSERAHALLSTVIAHPRRPRPDLVLQPYIERHAEDVTWLLERVEVGITGINVVVRLWTSWPLEARLEPGSEQALMHLRWKGFHPMSDDTGRTFRFVAGGISQAVTQVKTENWTGQRYCVTEDVWWRPGVAAQARALSLHAELDILVDRWVGGDSAPWSSRMVSLGSVNCTLDFPVRWSAGKFTPIAGG